jgi:hypothetical protein
MFGTNVKQQKRQQRKINDMEYFKRNMREKDKEETKLVGAEIPTNIFYYLTLFCIVDNCSKTSIIRPLIEKWEKKAKEKFSEKALIVMLANKGYNSWKNRNKKRNRNFATMINMQKRELKRKGVSDTDIETIIQKIENAKNTEN